MQRREAQMDLIEFITNHANADDLAQMLSQYVHGGVQQVDDSFRWYRGLSLNVTILKDALNCGSLEYTRGNHAYARGLFAGAVSTIMSTHGCNIGDALDLIRHFMPSDFDMTCMPPDWKEIWKTI